MENLSKCQETIIMQHQIYYFLYHDIYYKLMGKNLSMHPNMNIPQQINFTEKLKKHDGTDL